jgi:hypothetical protein
VIVSAKECDHCLGVWKEGDRGSCRAIAVDGKYWAIAVEMRGAIGRGSDGRSDRGLTDWGKIADRYGSIEVMLNWKPPYLPTFSIWSAINLRPGKVGETIA